jgi:hypothetical protein
LASLRECRSPPLVSVLIPARDEARAAPFETRSTPLRPLRAAFRRC